jgi:hypothetical protein
MCSFSFSSIEEIRAANRREAFAKAEQEELRLAEMKLLAADKKESRSSRAMKPQASSFLSLTPKGGTPTFEHSPYASMTGASSSQTPPRTPVTPTQDSSDIETYAYRLKQIGKKHGFSVGLSNHVLAITRLSSIGGQTVNISYNPVTSKICRDVWMMCALCKRVDEFLELLLKNSNPPDNSKTTSPPADTHWN